MINAKIKYESLNSIKNRLLRKWFINYVRFKDEDVENEDEAKIWLESATDAMYTAFNRSNFQQEIFEAYHDLIAFGTSCLMIEEDQEDVLNFSARHIKEIYIQENKKGFEGN